MRHWGSVVRLEVDRATPERIIEVLVRNLEISRAQVYQFEVPLGLSNLPRRATSVRLHGDRSDRPRTHRYR